MKNLKKISLASALGISAILLSGCAKPTATTPKNDSQTQTTTQTTVNSQQTVNTTQPSQTKPQLEPLPADDKTAIDNELKNIDNELKATSDSSASADLSNTQLGL